MAQLAISIARQTAISLAQSAASQAIHSLFAKDRVLGPVLEEMQVLQSLEGAPIPIVFGQVRIGGQVIWAEQPREQFTQSQAGGKGGPSTSERHYQMNFAVGLCEGEINGIGRIWADGKLLNASQTTLHVHTGAQSQPADSLIQASEGYENTPQFNGLAYIVFENFNLSDFGNRIPQLSFEVFRTPAGDLSSNQLRFLLQGITLIPGSGEFAYATEPVLEDLGPGVSRLENSNNSYGHTDIHAALDNLERTFPNCKTVSLVVSWFGDDLRCGQCQIQPGVESDEKVTLGLNWRVAGTDRTGAMLVSQNEGRPVYGGTPDDRSIMQAISELSSRGYKVVFYPFILMDIPSGNGLADPYGQTEQAAFPWRGRITCHPAAGQIGTVDKTATASSQVEAFFGTVSVTDFSLANGEVVYSGPEEWTFRRMILHYAYLCQLAGGVDAFLIGSEMRGLTRIRSSQDEFPAVDKLSELVSDVASILPDAKLSYGADWSEYFGYQPADGTSDVYFHLDPFWAHADVDFIGIDWYVPLSDWRDGNVHADADLASSDHDRDYLQANIEGGEGYDWFYASQFDRDNQVRTSITDGAYHKPWVFRYKDLAGWWSNAHFNRPAGVELAQSTPWVPQSKPIWFTETGCPAVNFGANQPNVFVDPKSSESTLPWYSNGLRDDVIQKNYGEALLDYWSIASNNSPQSSVYSGPMLAQEDIHFWTWDARPYPDFPARDTIWSDGENWALGHWLNGRDASSSLGAIIEEICMLGGIENLGNSLLLGIVGGFVMPGGSSIRQALAGLSSLYRFEVNDRFGKLHFASQSANADISDVELVEAAIGPSGQSSILHEILDAEEQINSMALKYNDAANDYLPAFASVGVQTAGTSAQVELSLPLAIDADGAKKLVEDMLVNASAGYQTLKISLPASSSALETGDVVRVPDVSAHTSWQVVRIEERGRRDFHLRSIGISPSHSLAGPTPGVTSGNPGVGQTRPDVVIFDLPLLPHETARQGPRIAAYADPWPGIMDVSIEGKSGIRAQLEQPAIFGISTLDIPAGGILHRWDQGSKAVLQLYSGSLSSLDRLDVLAGANSIAIQHDDGAWELIQFETALLLPSGEWELTGLLRGQGGTDFALASGISSGNRIIVMNGASKVLELEDYELGAEIKWVVCREGCVAGQVDSASISYTGEGLALLPRKPAHLRANMLDGQLLVSWVRRTRIGGDNWFAGSVPLGEQTEAYELRVFDADVEIFREETVQPSYTFSAQELTALYPAGLPSEFDLSVAQISAEAGSGHINRQILQV